MKDSYHFTFAKGPEPQFDQFRAADTAQSHPTPSVLVRQGMGKVGTLPLWLASRIRLHALTCRVRKWRGSPKAPSILPADERRSLLEIKPRSQGYRMTDE